MQRIIWHIVVFAFSCFSTNLTTAFALQTQPLQGGAIAGDRPRVIVSTDIGGSDPDDYQSMVHLFHYANVLDIEGLISSPPQQGRAKHIHEVINAYEKDFQKLRIHSKHFPTPDSLRAATKQGATQAAPKRGWDKATEGSRWIIERAKADDERPLWVLVWGSITDIAQAVHDDPSIKSKVRIYSIGSWNSMQDRRARDYLFDNHPDLWWIESDTTFRGMYVGGRQDGDLGNVRFVERHVKGHGALGDLFFRKKRDIKMGDTPSALYLLRGNPDDPQSPHWGGKYSKTDHGNHYWTDDPDKTLMDGGRNGAKTVNQWRQKFLLDWQMRLDWTLKD